MKLYNYQEKIKFEKKQHTLHIGKIIITLVLAISIMLVGCSSPTEMKWELTKKQVISILGEPKKDTECSERVLCYDETMFDTDCETIYLFNKESSELGGISYYFQTVDEETDYALFTELYYKIVEEYGEPSSSYSSETPLEKADKDWDERKNTGISFHDVELYGKKVRYYLSIDYSENSEIEPSIAILVFKPLR